MDLKTGGALIGILQGRKMAKERSRQEKMEDELFQLKKMEQQYKLQELRLKQQQAQQQQLMTKMFQPYIESRIQGMIPQDMPTEQLPGEEQTPMSPRFDQAQQQGAPQQGFTDQAAALQGILADPIMARWLQGQMEGKGPDFAGMSGDLETRRHNTTMEQQGWGRLANSMAGTDLSRAQYERGFSEADWVEQYNPQTGATERIRVPKYGGIGQSFTTKPSDFDTAIPPGDMPNYRNPAGETPSGRITPQQAMTQGFQPMGATNVSQMLSSASALDIITEMEALMEKVFPKSETAFERLFTGPSRLAGAVTQTNVDAAQLRKFTTGTLGPMIRALGEKGALAEGDVQRAMTLMPKLTDRADVAWNATNQIKGILEKAKNRTIGTASVGAIGKPKKATIEDAKRFLQMAGGDKDKARQLARDAGYEF